jgi:pantothenate kinase
MNDELDALGREVAALLRRGEVTADGLGAACAPSPDDLRDVLVPMLQWCLARRPAGLRGLVGIAAPPAAGKSRLLAGLAATARAMRLPGFVFASMDGYHLPNAVLDARTGVDPDGEPATLRELKGSPPTFDADRLLADLRRITGTCETVRLPAYSRVLHEPVPDAVNVLPKTQWVFLEGNFLFLDDPPWRMIRDLFDRRIFIEAAEGTLVERLRGRNRAAGRDEAWIAEHIRRTDLPNIRRVNATARWADLTLRWEADGTLRPVGTQAGAGFSKV